MKITGGPIEQGVVVGNAYDKYGAKNPVARRLMKGFRDALSDFVTRSNQNEIHDIGCGEGHWVIQWNLEGMAARGCDFSEQAIELARRNAASEGVPPEVFSRRGICDLEPGLDSADLIVCLEVLEHLERPEDGLEALRRVATDYVILSVPREPLWRLLNMARGKYLSRFGNTPGHLQHWSCKGFVELASRYFDVIAIHRPLPWTMLLCRRKPAAPT